jgi:hypothetical protein
LSKESSSYGITPDTEAMTEGGGVSLIRRYKHRAAASSHSPPSRSTFNDLPPMNTTTPINVMQATQLFSNSGDEDSYSIEPESAEDTARLRLL